jgi:hypothetical protein
MLSAVAWNYASAYFEMRIFTTDDKNDLYEYRTSLSFCLLPCHAMSGVNCLPKQQIRLPGGSRYT